MGCKRRIEVVQRLHEVFETTICENLAMCKTKIKAAEFINEILQVA